MLYIKPLQSNVIVRTGTADIMVLRDTFQGLYHLPPPEAGVPKIILDLGSNIGLTVAHYAALYKDARILGVELDPETAAVASRNVARWRDRCEIISGAVAPQGGGSVAFRRLRGEEWGAKILQDASEEGAIAVPAFSVSELITRIGQPLDFMKVDIEGTEGDLFRSGQPWAQKVKCLHVEVHAPLTIEEISDSLCTLGFRTRPCSRHPSAVVAWRG